MWGGHHLSHHLPSVLLGGRLGGTHGCSSHGGEVRNTEASLQIFPASSNGNEELLVPFSIPEFLQLRLAKLRKLWTS